MKIFDNIERALKYVDNHLSEQIGFEDVANALHFSPYHFHRMFSIVAGKTITAHIRDRRLEKACAALSNSTKATLEICFECGFDAYSSFIRAFKNKYGLSPKEYRKQGRCPVIISVDELIKIFKEKMEGGVMSEKIMKEIEELNKKIELEPDSWENYNARGHLYYDLDEFAKSVEDDTKAIDLEPNVAENFFHRGTSYHNLKEYDKSIEDCTQAIALNPENPQYYFGRGCSYRLLGEYKKAVDDFTKSIEIGSNTPYSEYIAHDYCERGVSYRCMEKHDKARADFAKAAEIDPGMIKAYETDMKRYEIT